MYSILFSLLYSLKFSRGNILRKLSAYLMVIETLRAWFQVPVHITAEHEIFLIKYLKLIIEAVCKNTYSSKDYELNQ